MIIENIKDIRSEEELLEKSQWLVGKTFAEITDEIIKSDRDSRVKTKGDAGYVIENGFFGIRKNSYAEADIAHLGIEIKTCPLKYNSDRTKLSVKEPLSLNIINYEKEVNNKAIKESSLYKKNNKIMFVLYIHDPLRDRSEYLIKYVFLWKMDDIVIDELTPDYKKIIDKIERSLAHEIHQSDHQMLTLCPKHSGKFNDPNCNKSKRKQYHSDIPAEVRAYRFKNSYMNKIICRHYGFNLDNGGWVVS